MKKETKADTKRQTVQIVPDLHLPNNLEVCQEWMLRTWGEAIGLNSVVRGTSDKKPKKLKPRPNIWR